MSETVAIIPARGGSKGIPGKNLRRVGGVPLVARAITAALRCPEIDRVVVSTDDDEIARVAREWGADIVTRPAKISGDLASSESALTDAIEQLSARSIDVGVMAFLQATSPFIDSAALGAAVRLVRSRRRDTVFSAVETYGFLWQKSFGGAATALNHDVATRPRRQDREPHFLETGAFYVMRAKAFLAVGHRFFGSIGIVEVPAGTELEIDTPAELEAARALARLVDVPEPIAVDAVVTDFDGVHTDDTATVTDAGAEAVRVSRADGYGVARLREADIPMLILSAETNPVVAARGRKLGVPVLQGVDDKASALRAWADEHDIPLARIAYLGNDLGDLGCLEIVGWPIAVRDAHPVIAAAARVVLDHDGGSGAVRELADRVLRARAAASPTPAVPSERTHS